jgi:hypothetical protein
VRPEGLARSQAGQHPLGEQPRQTVGGPVGRRGGGTLAAVVVIWLVIGLLAAVQRHYFSSGQANCAHTGTVLATVIAGPLNYLGANPKIKCHTPQPST